MHRTLALALAGGLIFVAPTTVRADGQAAQGYLKEAQDLIDRNDLQAAADKLDLAEEELDDATPPEKATIQAAIDTAKQKITQAAAAADKPKYQRKLKNAMDEAEQSIGNAVTWKNAETAVKEVLDDPAAKAALGPDLDAAAKKFATFQRLNARKASAQIEVEVEAALKATEQEWSETKGKIAANAADDDMLQSTQENIAETQRQIARLDKEDARLKEFTTRLDKVAGEFTQLALAGRVKEVVETLHRKIDSYRDDWSGYDKETAGPSWDQYRGQQSEKMSAFLAPRTHQFVTRMDEFLANLANDDDYQSVQTDAGVKAIVDDAKAKRDAAYAKLVKFVGVVVEGAKASAVKEGGAVDRLKDDVRVALGEKTPEGTAMLASLEQKMAANSAVTTGAEDARAKLVVMLHAKADDAWPKLREGISATTDYDMSKPDKFKGKNISFTADNLMGYRFKPGDFYYATTLGGFPVAAKIDPQLMQQITATEMAIGRALGDDDADGRWEVIATVTDRKARLMQRRQVEATGKIDNTIDVKLKGEYAEPVDAVVIEIIAAKCGPFTGVKGKGVLKEDGTVSR